MSSSTMLLLLGVGLLCCCCQLSTGSQHPPIQPARHVASDHHNLPPHHRQRHFRHTPAAAAGASVVSKKRQSLQQHWWEDGRSWLEPSEANCRPTERHVRCAPETYCEKSCDNLYSPPHCQHDENHPKCYYPRCVCRAGFVRGPRGECILASSCPNRYSEESSKVVFKPLIFRPRHKARVLGDEYYW